MRANGMGLGIDSRLEAAGLGGSTLRGRLVRVGAVLILTLLYIAAFEAIASVTGLVAAALVTLPVAAAGLFFGMEAGLLAGLLGILVSGMLEARLMGTDTVSAVREYWAGYLMVLLFGCLAGLLHSQWTENAQVKDRLRLREEFLTVIGTVTNSVLDPVEHGTAYRRLSNYLTHIFAADHSSFARWDGKREQAVLVDTSEGLVQTRGSARVLNRDNTPLVAAALKNQHVTVVENIAESPYAAVRDAAATLPQSAKSALCIPLISGEHAFGAVTLLFDKPRHFDAEEVVFADLFSRQISLALWTLEQQLEIQKRLKEADALMKIERALSTSERVGFAAILQLIVDSAKELIQGTERAVVHLIDEEQAVLVPRAVAGIAEGTTAPLNMHVGEGIAGYVIQTGEVIGISDTHSEPRFLSPASPSKFRSLITAPIESNERRLGTISIMSREPGSFTAEDGQLLGALGTYAAIAIENARLLETTREDLKEINSLYRVSQGLAASLDPDQLTEDVVELLKENFGFYHVQSYMVDPETGDLLARHGSGVIGNQLRERGHSLRPGEGIVGHVVESGKPFVTSDVNRVGFFVRNPLLPNTMSELTVPIKAGDHVVGALDIQLAPPDRLDDRDLQMVSAVASQLAVALQKAELYTELEASLKHAREMRMQLIHSDRLAVIGRLLASVSHELNNPLQAIQNALYLLKDDNGLTAQGKQDLDIVLSESERMASLIGRLRATYRPTGPEAFEPVQLNNIIADVHALTATYMRHRQIAFEYRPDEGLPKIRGIPEQIKQVVLNLFMNAIDAMPMNGRLAVDAQAEPGEGNVVLSVADSGPGIDADLLPHIFEPFVTDKETGTGLGLTISYDIVSRHQGAIQAENRPEGGALFRVWLPIERQAAA